MQQSQGRTAILSVSSFSVKPGKPGETNSNFQLFLFRSCFFPKMHLRTANCEVLLKEKAFVELDM